MYRSQAKSGTSHFHAYATACIVHKGLRYTVTIVPVAKGTAMTTVVQQLLKQCRSIGLECSLLLLDRGFYSVETLSYLLRIRTSTRNPLLRLFYFALSMILRNLWILFELEAVMNGKYQKQKTSECYSLENLCDENCFVEQYRF